MLRELDVAGILALVITTGFFGIVVVLATRVAPLDNREILSIVVGVLGASFGAVVQYYFGSSKSSQSKNDVIARLASEPAQPRA